MKLKIGLEIHAQLEGKKMFCHCPTVLRDDEPDFMVSRRLHAAAGETGQVDVAAMHEMKKQQTFVYEGYHGTNCLVELDEEPPHDLNQQVLETALQVAKLLKMKIVDSVQMMRKTVVDGSNTSGFQRTALVAHTGVIATSFGDVGVESLCIEEDAAKIISRKGDVGYTIIRNCDRARYHFWRAGKRSGYVSWYGSTKYGEGKTWNWDNSARCECIYSPM
jgi:glutamyl-tRNA(Gln) amidotransferase subunit E